MHTMKVSGISLAFACAAGLGLAGCSKTENGGKAGGAANADGATYDSALEDDPCGVVTTQMVATAFDIPAADIEQSNIISSMCSYEMEGDGMELNVNVSVEARETVEDAAKYFDRATTSMSAEEVSDAMSATMQQADENGALDTDGKKKGAESLSSAVQQGGRGIQFEDVDGVADQARLGTSNGALHLQEGNLLIEIQAYYGPEMPIPDSYVPGQMQKVVKAWMQDTMDERKTQSVKLAKIALDAL